MGSKNSSPVPSNLYQEPQRKLTGSILGRDPSPIQVLCESVQEFLCKPGDKPTEKILANG